MCTLLHAVSLCLWGQRGSSAHQWLFNFLLALIIVFNLGAYPLLLKIIARFKNLEHKIDSGLTPSVTVLIAAYNEGKVLREKLENCLELDYPEELLDIVVVSDGSTDSTEGIVKEFESRGIRLLVNEVNQGKATALNNGIENITSSIVVLSDANVMYQRDGIRNLVRHFADDNIGAVSGKVVLLNEGLSYSDGEDAYYAVEHNIQQLESNTGNLIGADGAMYALRRELYRPLLADTLLDDFVLSMGVIQQHKRLIFDPQALGFEKNTAEIASEFNRKVRIVAGGIQSLQRKTVWPPQGNTLTALKLTCHKVMRWIIGPVIVLFFVLTFLLGLLTGHWLLVFLPIATALCVPAVHILNGFFPHLRNDRLVKLSTCRLVMVNASLVGCYKALTSRKISWR